MTEHLIHSNTLVFTNLPSCIFESHILNILRTAVEAYAIRSDNELYSWIPLPSFNRAIAIFWDSGDAQLCKDRLDRLAVGGQLPQPTPHLRKRHRARSDCAPLASDWNNRFLLRVFSLPPTPTPVSTDAHRSFYLSVPGIEKNFLISPPGSPPVGWEPVREDPPNTETLAEDLVAALTTIRHADADAEDVADYKMDEAMDLQVWDDTDGTAHTPHILLTPQRDVPGVSIANYTNITLPTAHTEPRQSSLPTKATSESMGGRKSHTRTPSLVVPDEVGGLGASTTITPTARPPV